MMHRWFSFTHRSSIQILLLALLLTATLGCSLYRNDRMWISEEKYATARSAYDTTGSLALTEEALRESHVWQRAQINEAIYRLKKEYRLD